jgi:hypothetical protein
MCSAGGQKVRHSNSLMPWRVFKQRNNYACIFLFVMYDNAKQFTDRDVDKNALKDFIYATIFNLLSSTNSYVYHAFQHPKI